MELNRLLEIANDREVCAFCVDCDDAEVCFKCEKVKGIMVDELREYHAAVKDALRRTAEIDKLREDGRLVVLPCKVGDTAYFILPAFDQENIFEEHYVSEPHKITEAGTRGFWTSAIPNEQPDAMHYFTDWSDFGKTVFLTCEEAEVVLEGGKENA